MDKPTLICEYAQKEHGSNKPYVHDVDIIGQISWKVAGLESFRKKLKAERKKLEKNDYYDLDFPKVRQTGLMKLCEHRHAKM
jgi:hypothetical protein